MRSISENGLTTLANKLGNESIAIIEIDWTDGTSAYADRTVQSIPGKIVELGDLDDATSLSGGNSTAQLSVTLDDTDGTIKSILDTHDVHKRTARVYQYFTGLDLSDKFLLFAGVLMTPISWNERDRTVKVTIVSQLEDQECGWTTDENIEGVIPDTIPNEAWPLIFGTVLENKAVQLRPPVSGTTLDPIGVLAGEELMIASPDDPGLDFQMSVYKANSQLAFIEFLIQQFSVPALNPGEQIMKYNYDGSTSGYTSSYAYTVTQADADVANAQYAKILAGYEKQYHDLYIQLERKIIEWRAAQEMTREMRLAKVKQAELQGYGTNPVRILDGHNFPQGAVTANISGAIFTGIMNGDYLTIESRSAPYYEDIAAGINNAITNGLAIKPTPVYYTEPNLDGTYSTVHLYGVDTGMVSDTWFWSAMIPDGDGGLMPFQTAPIAYTITRNQTFDNIQSILQHMWIDAGASVQIFNADSLVYGVSLVPGTITRVQAMCTVSGVQLLRDVTDYTVGSTPCGPHTGITITLPQRLSTIANEHWSDDLYINFISSVGPSVTDIVRYIVENYSDLTCDDASFAACTVPSPANFAINTSRNVLQVLQDIAFQSSCSLRVVNRVVYITYLPPRPTAVDTITVSDIDAERGIEVSLTTTEELMTKMTVNWSELPVPALEQVNEKVWTGSVYVNRMIPGNDPGDLKHPSYVLLLRNNVEKYGMHDATYNYTIFNDRSFVEASAKFWLARKSNSWKKVAFTTPMHKLNLETFDAVTLDFAQPYVATGPVLAIIESAQYDSANNCIHFVCVTPVLAGTSADCGFYWSN